jgi:hypothetical protein
LTCKDPFTAALILCWVSYEGAAAVAGLPVADPLAISAAVFGLLKVSEVVPPCYCILFYATI